jgi:hypothetical protein
MIEAGRGVVERAGFLRPADARSLKLIEFLEISSARGFSPLDRGDTAP